MMVDESGMLEVSIYNSLHVNRGSIDSYRLLLDVMTIADEVDAQLSCAVASYVAESHRTSRSEL